MRLLKRWRFAHFYDKPLTAARLAPVNPSPKIWLTEVYFESKNYEKVVDICHDILTYENLPDRSKEVADLWVNTESAEETVVRVVNSED